MMTGTQLLQRIGCAAVECASCGDKLMDGEACGRCALLSEMYESQLLEYLATRCPVDLRELASRKLAAGSPGALYLQKHGVTLWDRLPAREYLGTVSMRSRMQRAADRLIFPCSLVFWGGICLAYWFGLIKVCEWLHAWLAQ